MKQYIHKQLGRTTEYKNNLLRVNVHGLSNHYTEPELLALGFEEVKDTRHPGRYWKPENDYVNHYFINSMRVIQQTQDRAILGYSFGNSFETQELAQAKLDKDMSIVKIMEYISSTYGLFEPDWEDEDQDKSGFYYNNKIKQFIVYTTNYNQEYSPIEYFSCKEHAKDIIEKFDAELKLIYNIK